MKNALFTGIARENPSGIAHHLGRGVQYRSSDQSRASPWRSRSVTTIGMSLFTKTVARNIIVALAPSFAVTGLLL